MGNAMDLMTQQNIPGLPGSHPHNNLPGISSMRLTSFDGWQ